MRFWGGVPQGVALGWVWGRPLAFGHGSRTHGGRFMGTLELRWKCRMSLFDPNAPLAVGYEVLTRARPSQQNNDDGCQERRVKVDVEFHYRWRRVKIETRTLADPWEIGSFWTTWSASVGLNPSSKRQLSRWGGTAVTDLTLTPRHFCRIAPVPRIGHLRGPKPARS